MGRHTTKASDGPTGTATVTFGTTGTVSWTGSTGTYTGTFSGTSNPDHGASVTATITGQGAASACVYIISGTVSNGVFDGAYHLQGSCIDRSGHGTFHLVQGESIPTSELCVVTLSASSLNVDHSAHTHQTVTVTRTGDCSSDITVSGLPDWIHVESNSGGVLSLKIDENSSNPSATRAATLLIAGQNFVVTQTGKEASTCNYTLAGPQNAATIAFPSAGGSGLLNVDTSQGNCTWTIAADVPWITGINPASDKGKSAVSYSVQMNTSGAQRSGHISIQEGGASAVVTVTQDAAPVVCTAFSVTPTDFKNLKNERDDAVGDGHGFVAGRLHRRFVHRVE